MDLIGTIADTYQLFDPIPIDDIGFMSPKEVVGRIFSTSVLILVYSFSVVWMMILLLSFSIKRMLS